MKLAFAFLSCCTFLVGCGANPAATVSCTLTNTLEIMPNSGTADHSASPPGNQVQFNALVYPVPNYSGCPVPQHVQLAYASWTSNSPMNVTIDSSASETNGLATCVNSVAGPITLTATATVGAATQSATTQLACK